MMELKNLINASHLDRFPEEYQLVADIIGFDSMLKLAESYEGQGIYFPKLNKVVRSVRDEQILQNFTGYNQRELAAKFGISERWVYEVIKQKSRTR